MKCAECRRVRDLVNTCRDAANLLHDRYGIRVGEDTPRSKMLERLEAAVVYEAIEQKTGDRKKP